MSSSDELEEEPPDEVDDGVAEGTAMETEADAVALAIALDGLTRQVGAAHTAAKLRASREADNTYNMLAAGCKRSLGRQKERKEPRLAVK